MELMTSLRRRWPGRTPRPKRPDTKPARRGARGLTLVEVPIAMTILGFGLLAMAPLFTSSVKTNASSMQLTNANTLAREKMEELTGFPSTDPRLAVPATANATESLRVVVHVPRRRVVDTNLTVRNMIEQLDNQLKMKPEDSPYYQPVKDFPAAIGEARRAADDDDDRSHSRSRSRSAGS